MSDKPTYLGLLNAIANGEGEAEKYLNAWADVTPRDDVRSVLRTVALREGEHAKAFEKRMCELGYALVCKVADGADERLRAACSTELSDREKFECIGVGRAAREDGPDIFSKMFDDKSIDIQTGMLLGRYIAEERDSGRMLSACYQALVDDECSSGSDSSVPSTVQERLDRIERMLEKLVSERG